MSEDVYCMKKYLLSKQILLLVIAWSPLTWSDNYNYSELTTKNYDEMLASVKERIQKAQEVEEEDLDEAKSKLKDAVRLILSRPNTDNVVSPLIQHLRAPLRNLEIYESTLSDVVDSAVAVANSKSAAAKDRATALIQLENFLSEFKPESKNNEKVRVLFEQIRDAKISVDNKVKSEFRMRGAYKAPGSPSDIANKIFPKKK